MPEGDTIHRTAVRLRSTLEGRPLTRVDLPRLPPPLPAVGAVVNRVEARGKHLLVRHSDGLVVHTHQRMTGSWHVYRPGARWRRAAGSARVVLGVADAVAVCFGAPVVEVLDETSLDRHPVLRRLGPDLTDPDPDLDDAMRRVRRLVADHERAGHVVRVGDLLLNQGVACGIGNVYRCEVLFLHGLHPAATVDEVGLPVVRAMFATAGELLRVNLSGSWRTTVAGGRDGSLWVYGRAGAPCRVCGSVIMRERSGSPSRLVDRCPSCQPTTGGRTPSDRAAALP